MALSYAPDQLLGVVVVLETGEGRIFRGSNLFFRLTIKSGSVSQSSSSTFGFGGSAGFTPIVAFHMAILMQSYG